MDIPRLTTLPLDGALINSEQLVGLDAAFFAMDMLSMAYWRLVDTLPNHPGTRAGTVTILDDAWSIVDNANRLHVLLRSVKGLKQGAAPVKDALKHLHLAEPLRNIVQHLGGELAKTAASGRAAWGEVYWSHLSAEGVVAHHLLWTGTQYVVDAEIDVPAPPDGYVESESPDFIFLLRHPTRLNVSEIARAVDRLRSSLEGEITRSIASLPDHTPLPTLLRLTFPGAAQTQS